MRATQRCEARPGTRGEGGFTLVEFVVAMGIAAFAFAAVGIALGQGLSALAVQKARVQGNEVATQGIEDLQRLPFDSLVVCSVPSGTVPSGFSLTATAPSCPADTSSYGENPCTGANPTQAPSASYNCSRINITFKVRRYVAWTDAGHTAKRMAVFVDWTDRVGNHTVSQQSSLRSPTGASIIGVSNPTLSSPSVSPGKANLTSSPGELVGSVTFSVTASSVGTSDSVFAKFLTLDPLTGQATPVTLALTPNASGTSWSKTITSLDLYLFGAGSQFVTFTAIRTSDGKANSVISSSTKFCSVSDDQCTSSNLPQFTSTTVPATVGIDFSGAMKADFTVTAVTKNVTATDDVQVILPTLNGSQVLSMQTNAATCTTASCTWTATIPKAAGYSFASGTRSLAFSAAQDLVVGSLVDQGSTASASSSGITFS